MAGKHLYNVLGLMVAGMIMVGSVGCTTYRCGSKFEPVTARPNEVPVYIYTPWQFIGLAHPGWLVSINGKRVAQMRVGTYVVQTVPRGSAVSIVIDGPSTTQAMTIGTTRPADFALSCKEQLVASAETEYYLKATTSFEVVPNVLQQVGKETAVREIVGLKRAVHVSDKVPWWQFMFSGHEML